MRTPRDHRLERARSTQGRSDEALYHFVLSLGTREGWSGDLLDAGPGTGNFIRHLLAGGHAGTLTGADLFPRPADLPDSVRWIEADLDEPLPLPDASFDTITCLEVIAHLENPRALFREFARLLRPGGRLILSSPNLESLRSYQALLFGGHFAFFHGAAGPMFITALLREDFTRLCAETGFTPPAFHYSNAGLIPKVHLSWQRLSLGLLRGRFFSDNFALVARKK